MDTAFEKLRIYLFFCILMFFFLLFVTMFYSFGYRYSINDKKTIQTGSIVIKSIPQNADIYLDGKLYKSTGTIDNLFSDFLKIGGLYPRKYNLRITKSDYFDWEKNIEIKGGRATEFKNIILLKKKYKRKFTVKNIESDLKYINIWPSERKNKIAYVKNNENSLNVPRLFIFDLKTNNENIVFNNEILFIKEKDYAIRDVIWIDSDKKIITKAIGESGAIWHLIDLGNGKIYNITFLFAKEEMKYKWNFDIYGESIFFLSENNLYRFDYKRLYTEKIAGDIIGFLLDNSHLYYLKTDGKMYYANLNNPASLINAFSLPKIFNLDSKVKIKKSISEAYLILFDTGKLYFMDESGELHFLNSFVKDAHFFKNGERIIYSNDHEVWIYYLKEKISQPAKKEFTSELITRYSGNISNVFLYKDEEHIFYKEGDFLKFAELDDRNRRNVFNILELEGESIFYSSESDSLYYIEDGKLTQIDLEEK